MHNSTTTHETHNRNTHTHNRNTHTHTHNSNTHTHYRNTRTHRTGTHAEQRHAHTTETDLRLRHSTGEHTVETQQKHAQTAQTTGTHTLQKFRINRNTHTTGTQPHTRSREQTQQQHAHCRNICRTGTGTRTHNRNAHLTETCTHLLVLCVCVLCVCVLSVCVKSSTADSEHTPHPFYSHLSQSSCVKRRLGHSSSATHGLQSSFTNYHASNTNPQSSSSYSLRVLSSLHEIFRAPFLIIGLNDCQSSSPARQKLSAKTLA